MDDSRESSDRVLLTAAAPTLMAAAAASAPALAMATARLVNALDSHQSGIETGHSSTASLQNWRWMKLPPINPMAATRVTMIRGLLKMRPGAAKASTGAAKASGDEFRATVGTARRKTTASGSRRDAWVIVVRLLCAGDCGGIRRGRDDCRTVRLNDSALAHVSSVASRRHVSMDAIKDS